MTSIRVFLLLLTAAPLSATPLYRFSLDGNDFDAKVSPVIGERLGLPSPGDIGFIEKIPFVLQKPGHYHFRSRDGKGLQFYCKIDDSAEFLAAVRTEPKAGATGRNANPLATLTSKELSNLMGIDLQAPSARWNEVLAEVDWTRTSLRIVTHPPATDLPALPTSLRYLSLDATSSSVLRDLSALRLLGDLRFLDLTLPEQAEISLEALSLPPGLRNLSVRGGTLKQTDLARDQNSLRFLKLRSVKGLESVDFVKHFPSLRVLKIDDSAVSDLQPLAGLKDLRLFSANRTQVGSLPPLDSLPALRDLRLHSTPVAERKEVISPLRPKLNILIKNWDPAIRAFEEHDKKNPPPKDPILFIGSSSIRNWDLKKSFPDLPALNRGFGGSELSDSLRYFDRIVLPYRPQAILLYAGDNDVANGETAEQVVADYKSFAAKVRSTLPGTHFAFFPIKPSLSRWDLWPEMNKANQAIRKLTESDPHLHYLDTATPMLGSDRKPMPILFLKDGLHLSEAGYAIWNGIVRIWLQTQRGAGARRPS